MGLLNDAEHYNSRRSTTDSRLDYLERRAAQLPRLVDAVGDESSRYLAQDAEDRAEDLRARAEAMARECGDGDSCAAGLVVDRLWTWAAVFKRCGRGAWVRPARSGAGGG